MNTDKPILKEVAQALYDDNFAAFKQTVMPLLNFDEADEKHAPTSANPDARILLKNFCDEEAAYEYNHLDLLEAPDPYFLCEWVDETQDPSPCPNYTEWHWESISGVRQNAQTLAYYDPMCDERSALIETLYDKYGDACIKSQQNVWLKAFYDQILEELNENNVLFYPRIYPWMHIHQTEDVSQFLHFLPREKEWKMNSYTGMLSRSEYKFLLQIKVDYEDALFHFKQSQLYRNAVMLYLGDLALTAFDDTFNSQYDPKNSSTVDIASEDNIIEKLTLALQACVAPTTAAITKSDLWRGSDYITYPSLYEIAQVERKDHTIAEILPNGERKLFNAYRISATPQEFICLEELLDHLPYTNEQVLDCIKLCCDSVKLNTVDKILSQLACNLCEYVPYGGKHCDKDGAYEDIGFHFVEGTNLEKVLKQFHADDCFDYISYGKQLAEKGSYCVGEYGYIPDQAYSAENYPECQFTKSDVITLGQYVAGVVGQYSGVFGQFSGTLAEFKRFEPENIDRARAFVQKLETCGITLKDVPDYINVHEQEQDKPCEADVFTSTLDAAEKQAAAEITSLPPSTPPEHER